MDKQAYPQMRQIPYRVWARYFGTGAQSYQEALGRRHDRRNVFELCFEGWQHLVFICFDVPRLLSHSPATTTSQFKKKKPSAYVVGLSQLHREHQHPFQLMLLLQHAKKQLSRRQIFSLVLSGKGKVSCDTSVFSRFLPEVLLTQRRERKQTPILSLGGNDSGALLAQGQTALY